MKVAKNKNGLSLIMRYLIIFCWIIVTILPIYVAFITSLTPFERVGEATIFPKYFYWENYTELLKQVPLGSYLKASVIYAVSISCLTTFIATLAAYALSRFNFKAKIPFLMMIVAIQVIPQIIIVTPLYSMFYKIGLLDTYFAVILAMLATAIANPILVLKGFFDSIPVTLEEAALIDGCTRIEALFKIVLPISLPGIATAFALSFFTGWDTYIYPMILTSSADKVPLTVGLSRMVDFVTPWNLVMAGTIISIIPPIIIYLFAQRYLVSGLVAGSDK